MAFRKKPQSHEPTNLDHYDDPLALHEEELDARIDNMLDTDSAKAMKRLVNHSAKAIPTGFDETDDANRQLAIHFQNGLFCRNCETYFTERDRCPHCKLKLSSIGTPPLKRKF